MSRAALGGELSLCNTFQSTPPWLLSDGTVDLVAVQAHDAEHTYVAAHLTAEISTERDATNCVRADRRTTPSTPRERS
jgi:hypothetical protein